MTLPETETLGAALARLAALLPQPPSPARLAELRAAAAAAVATLKASPHAHGYTEAALEAAAALWNHSLGLDGASSDHDAALKQAALDLQWAALDAPSLPGAHQLRLAEQALRTAELWGELAQWEAADASLARAAALAPALSAATGAAQERAAVALFGSLLLRLRVCLRLGQELPAGAALLKLKEAAGGAALLPRQRTIFTLDLLATLVFEGEDLLEAGKPRLAVQMLQAAHEAHGALAAAAGELAAAGVAADAEALGARALVLLAWAHLEAGGAAERALGCVQALQRLGGRGAAAAAVPLLSHRALLQAGRAADAQTELLKLVTHEDAGPESCAAAIRAALAAPGGADAARAALAAAQEFTSAEDYGLVILLAEAVLGRAGDGSADDGADTKDGGGGPSDDALEVILELLEDDALAEALEEPSEARAAAKDRLRALCWNAACGAMEGGGGGGGGAARADRLFVASSRFLAAGDTDGAAETQMALALCAMAQGNAPAALRSLEVADAVAPGRPAVALLRLRACLAAGDEVAAAEAVKAMADSGSGGADALRVACCEAMDGGAPAAAAAALERLLSKLQAPGGGDAQGLPPGYEAVVFQNLIQLELAAAAGSAGRAAAEAAQALVRRFGALLERLGAIGMDEFYAGEEGGRWAALQWAQLQAWNAGVGAAAAGALGAAAALLGRCGDLCAAHPVSDPSIARRGHLAYVMAAAAAMDGPDPSQGGLLLAAQHLAAATSAATAAPEGALDPKALVYAQILEFAAAARRGDGPGAAAAVAAAAAAPAATAEHFAKMAALAEGRCSEGRRAALEAALARLTSQPEVNAGAAAAACRGLLDAAGDDAVRLAALKEAAALAAAAPPGTFPAMEARYLATVAWNRGATHGKLGRPAAAAAFMAAALRLARAPGAGDPPVLAPGDVAKMEEELERVKAAAGAEGAAVGADSDFMATG